MSGFRVSFEERFANLGRAIDSIVESIRTRRARHFRRAAGPTIGERLARGKERATTAVSQHASEWLKPERRARMRGPLIGAALVLVTAFVTWRLAPGSGGPDHSADLARLRGRAEERRREATPAPTVPTVIESVPARAAPR